MRFSKIIKPSPTLKLGELARAKQNMGEEVISLAIGEPDFPTPKFILDATAKAMYDGFTGYSTPQGLIELRQNISRDYLKRYDANYSVDEIIIFPGAKAAIFASLAALLEPNDEVIIIEPYYVSYPPMIKLAEPDSKIITIPLNKDFSLPIKKIAGAINNQTKVLILNYPNNPSGMLLNEDEVLEIVNLISNNSNLYLITDEIYEKLIYQNHHFISFASYQQIKNQMIVINGYSKSYAMTGFRLGYALSSKEIINKMNLFNQNTNTNTNTFIQYGALSIYKNNDEHLANYLKTLEERSNFFHQEINQTKYFSGIKPNSSFYYFINISKTNLSSTDLANLLIDKYGLVTTPGISFGESFDNHIRISLAVDIKILEKAITIFKNFNI